MRATLLTPLAVLALLVGGCTSDDPDPAPPTSSSPTPSDPTTSPTPTQTETAAEGPKAFIRRWTGALNDLLSDGRVKPFVALSSDECLFCDGVAGRIRSIKESGGSIETNGWTITSLERTGGTDDRPSFAVAIDVDEATELDADGEVVNEYEGEQVNYTIFLVRTGGSGWLLGDVTKDAS